MDPLFDSYFTNNLAELRKTLDELHSHFDLSTADLDPSNSFEGMHRAQAPFWTKTQAVYPSYGELKQKQGSSSSPSSPPALSNEQLLTYQGRDITVICRLSKDIIAGYLNLKESDGWKEGSSLQAGDAFTRFMLVGYYLKKKEDLKYHSPVIEKAIHAYSYVGSFGESASASSHRPQKSRISYDAAVTGWKQHKIARLVGNLGSAYDPSKPFFEIIVNSQRSSHSTLCQPYHVSIYANEKALDARRERLLQLSETPQNEATPQYYDESLTKADAFLKQNKARLGPNSTHLLEGLVFLQNKTIRAQKSGNCWVKQPMRSLLAGLFVEYHTDVKGITPKASWDQSKAVYQRMQKAVAIPHVAQLISAVDITPSMKQKALQNLEIQKKL